MSRLLISLLLGLSLVSCDKPGVDRLADDETARQQPQNRRHISLRTPVDPVAELRERLSTANAITSPAAREKALTEVAWNAIGLHPETAHEAFRQLPVGSPEKLRLIKHYAMRAAGQNPEQAIEWAVTLETESETCTALCHIALEIAATDPVHAANLLSEFGIEGRDFDVALVQVVQRWAATTPPDAAEWVAGFSPGAARQASIQAVMERWLPHDARAAFDWLETGHDDTFLKEAMEATLGVHNQQTPQAREAWIHQAPPEILATISRETIPAHRNTEP